MSQGQPGLLYSFKGKKILVTGGGRGVGLALVSRLYQDGAKVFTLDKDATFVENLRKEFPDSDRFRAERCDVSQWNETQTLIESFGPLDHLVNCAGILAIEDIMNVTEDLVDSLFGTNLKSIFCVSQAVAKAMIFAGIPGTIVNVCSIWGSIAAAGSSIYSSTKAGAIMLTKSLAVDLGKHGIRVNSVSPTTIDSAMYQENKHKYPSGTDPTWFMNRQPLAGRRVLHPDEVVNAILYLLSPLSGITTGTELLLNPGITSC